MKDWYSNARRPSYEPDETARRIFVRFLFKIKILNREKHLDILMRYRS